MSCADPLIRHSLIFRWLSSHFDTALIKRYGSIISVISQVLLLCFLFFSLFMPLIPLGALGTTQVDLRGEDFILPMLAGLALFFMPANNRPAASPVENSFLLFLIICQISIVYGLYRQTVDKPLVSVFYLLKWVEYFLAFVIARRLAAAGNLFFMTASFFVAGLAVAAYGYWEFFFPFDQGTPSEYYRLYEHFPFHGNANHMGAFFILWICFFSGVLIKTADRRLQGLLFTSLGFVFFPFLWTYSRKSYLALLASFLFSFWFLSVKQKKTLVSVFLVMFLGFCLPTGIRDRFTSIAGALLSSDPFHSSWAGNWMAWKKVFWNFESFFLLGSGWGSRHRFFYESQYVQVLAETGIAGFLAFGALCAVILNEFVKLCRSPLTPERHGMVLGWGMGLAGFLVHSATCVSFTAAKSAIFFWFLSGMVLGGLKKGPVSQL